MPLDAEPRLPTASDAGPPKAFLVGVLYYGPIDREHDRCVQLLRKSPLVSDVLELSGCPYIDMGRSIIATKVLDDPELGGLLFLDHDMVFETEDAELCIRGAIEAAAVCGAAYSMRRPGKMIGAIDGGKIPEGEQVVFFEGGKPRPASYLGMGMTAMARSVLVALVKKSQENWASQQAHVALLQQTIELLGSSDFLSEIAREHVVTLREAFQSLVPCLKSPDLPRLSTGLSEAPCVPFFSHLQRIMPAPEGRDGYYFG